MKEICFVVVAEDFGVTFSNINFQNYAPNSFLFPLSSKSETRFVFLVSLTFLCVLDSDVSV
jgi:hypothetical protein